ncbi:MAG: hypothetical protein INH41_08675 [Myxococcaceae bacterium]|nr:hypothetical protein [Myxococcaceae bacterium]
MPSITVKRGVQFRPDLFNKSDRSAWFDAVGKELETRGVSLKVGEGAAAKVVKDGASLKAAMKELQGQATASNQSVRAYVTDLVQAMDDVVVGGKVKAGDVFDLSRGSGLARALGLDDATRANYAASTTEFGRAARLKPEATMAIDGVTLQIIEPTVVDLTGVPHMSAETLKNAPITYGRDGEEVEDTRVITGLTKEETVALAASALNDLQRSRAVAGLTVGTVPLEEMSWESDAHALRRANPYVSFTLDSRSYEVNPNNGQPRVAIGRDFFFDTFMAKKDLKTGKLTKDLQKADLMYRARIRYGSDRDPFAGTRVLIGMKEGTAIDASGTKHARKIDSRTDSANQQIFDTLLESAATGKLNAAWGWNGSNSVAPAAASMYRVAVQKGITENVGGETNVLALEAGAVARQIRGRFHLDETDQSALVSAFRDAGEPRIKELADLIAAAPDFPAANGQPSKAQLLQTANALLDRSAIVAAAAEGLKKLDPALTVDKALIDRLWPGQPISGKQDAKLQRVVADAIRGRYDAFAESVDQLQRSIGGNTDRAVRDAGSASDVRDFLRGKAATSLFMAWAEMNGRATVGQPATYVAAAKQIVDMPDGREKTDLLQRIGVGLNQLRELNEASFASPVRLSSALTKQQTFGGFLKEFDAQLAGPNKDAFLAELGASLRNSPLSQATDKAKVAQDLRKNLVAAHVEVLHRMVEGAGGWSQAIWFNTYRQQALGINPQSWNFIIGSMDYTEFYDAKAGQALSFQDRTSRRPLDAAKMSGAMISNDIQIELEAEAGYTSAIRKAQYALNGAAAGLMMDYALAKGVPGLTPGDAPAFEKWFATQNAKTGAPKQAFLDELNAFARQKGSPIDFNRVLRPLGEQEDAIRTLSGFALKKNPQLQANDRAGIEAWYRQQANQGETELNAFLTEVAQYAAEAKSEIPLSPELLKTLDFKPFAAGNVGQPVTGHGALVDDLSIAQEVWTMMKKAQQDLSAARGNEVQRILRDNNLQGRGWDPPTKAKGDYAIDYALR